MTKAQRQYFIDILKRIRQIERFTAGGEDVFYSDDRTQEATIRCFEVIGEAIKRLDPSLTAQYPSVPWRGFAGMRDVLIHQYDDVQLDTIWETIHEDIPTLKEAVQALLDSLPDEDNT